MRYYIDSEFDGHNGQLISMAIVREDCYSIYIEVANKKPIKDTWVRDNVIPILGQHNANVHFVLEPNEVGLFIRSFIKDDAVIIADSPVDIYRFCRALSTGLDGEWLSSDYDRLTFEVHNVDCYPTDLPGAIQHNAWWDAMALRYIMT